MNEQDVRRIGSTIILLLIAPGWGLAQTRQQPKIHPPSPSGGEPNTAATILVSPDQDYRIGPRDVIEVRVDDAPELSITTSVNADGTFLMPYLKRVKAAGKTSEELGKEIGAVDEASIDPAAGQVVVSHGASFRAQRVRGRTT